MSLACVSFLVFSLSLTPFCLGVQAKLRSYHVCRYKPSLYLPYVRFQEEILSTSPYASLFYNFVSDTEISQIKNYIRGRVSKDFSKNSHWQTVKLGSEDDSLSPPLLEKMIIYWNILSLLTCPVLNEILTNLPSTEWNIWWYCGKFRLMFC